MSEKQTKLTIQLDDAPVKLTLQRSTTATGIRRSLMIYKAMDEHDKDPEGDEVLYVLKSRTLPDIICGTESAEGIDFPITAEGLAKLPEEFVDNWLAEIYKINPHWNPANFKLNSEEEVKKK